MLRLLGFAVLGVVLAEPATEVADAEAADAATAPEDDGPRRIVGVVTFEGSSPHAAALSRALAAGLRGRGHKAPGGLSLTQVQTELGCTNYEPPCMAKAAQLFEAELVVYGTLRADGNVHQLEAFLLDASRGEVQSHVSAAIPERDLADTSIDNKALDVLDQLWPLPTNGGPPPPPPPAEAFEDVEGVRPRPAADGEPGKLRWGRERPVKKWKWAGFGATAGVLGVGTVLAIVGATRIRQPGGPLERELYKQADESLTDTYGDQFGPAHPSANELNPENDVDRSEGGNLCGIAESPPPGMPERVTNADVATVCKDIRIWTAITNAGTAMAVVGLVGVVTFTTLMFVHRERAGARARVSPRPDGLSVRF
jgi:hypothetical protein